MSNDGQQQGGQRDGLERRTSGPGYQVHQPRTSRPAPGKATLTSKIPPAHEPVIQRKAATTSRGAAPPARSRRDPAMDSWMDAAHRGLSALAGSSPAAIEARGGASAAERARTIHEAFHGSLFAEDEEHALDQLRGQAVAAIRRIRGAYKDAYGTKLEDEFSSYCDGDQAAEALALLWPAMPVIDRLERNIGSLGDNEDGMMDVLRTSTRGELEVAAADARLSELLDELSIDQQYEARRLIWPSRAREHVLWRIEQAHGTLDDDEDAVYSALLDLTPAERRALWDERAQQLSFLSEGELSLVRRMCVGEDGGAATDAEALGTRMQIATEGLGTDDEAVSMVVGRVASLAEEETRLRATLEAGSTPEGEALPSEQRAAIEARLAELGGVHENLLTSPRDHSGALAEDSFLGRLHDDVGTDEYGGIASTMGGDAYERAKQQLLDAVGAVNDDEQAIYGAFRDLRAPLTLPSGRTTADHSPDELRQMREQATNALRQRLRNDPDLAPVWSALDDDELAVLDVHVAGDGYRIAIHELEDAYHGVDTDEARIVRVAAGMPAADRARMVAEQPPIYTDLMTGLAAAEADLVAEVFRTGRVPTERALDVAMGDWGDGTDEQMLLDGLGSMSDVERRGYRLGYWLHRQGRSASEVAGDTERAALQRFVSLQARMESELDDEERDAAMERLIGLPAPEDFLSPEGRRMAAEIMAHRHRERLALSGGVTDSLTSTDETAEQSAMIYEAHLQALLARGGEISLEDFSVLVGLDAQFGGRFDEHRATVELVSNLAGTVAATVAAVVIVVLSEGTLAPAAAELISSSGGAALWAAVAGAGARVGASEALGGDFHQTTSAEGARGALVGAIEGAVAVASAALAARAVELVGLGQRALGAEITRAALDSAEAGLALSGRGLARGSLEGAIDGFVSGAVGDLVMTATDAETWRRSVWNTLGNLGMSLLRGGAFGAGGGAAAGGAMHGAGALMRGRGLREAPESAGPHGGQAHGPGKASPAGQPLPRDGRRRTPQEHAALAAELPPELRGSIDIVESDAIEGAGVHVAYKDGALRIEVGPEAEPRHVRYHADTTRHLLKYQGPLGQVRRLLDAILTKLRLTPGFGTRGFEARQEVAKLLEIQGELTALRARLDGRVRALEGHGDPSQLDARQLARELAEIQEQLEYHQGFIDSYEPGRGFVAAEGKGRSLPELAVARRDLFEIVSEEGSLWRVDFHAKVPDGQEVWIGKGTVTLDEQGIPKSYPSFTLDATVGHAGKDHAVRIYDDVSVQAGEVERGMGQRHSATAHAIERMSRLYSRRFGHPPEALEGILAWSNKANFQREYYRLTEVEALSKSDAAVAAVKNISFGAHRMSAGYDNFEVTLAGTERVDLGPPFGVQRVPKRISVVARRDT